MKIRIAYRLYCEVDQKKGDCLREMAHCHITRNGIRVAKVWLNPVRLEEGHSLHWNEVGPVLRKVSENRANLEMEYCRNRLHGA